MEQLKIPTVNSLIKSTFIGTGAIESEKDKKDHNQRYLQLMALINEFCS